MEIKVTRDLPVPTRHNMLYTAQLELSVTDTVHGDSSFIGTMGNNIFMKNLYD